MNCKSIFSLPVYLVFLIILFFSWPVSAQKNSSSSPTMKRGLKLWYTSPSKSWSKEALPIGNGFMGGMVYGGIEIEQVQYNEKTLWSGGPGAWKEYQGGNNDSAAMYLREIRGMVAKKNFENAEKVMSAKMLGNPRAFGDYQNFGNIYLDFSAFIDSSKVNFYKRELDLEKGIVRVMYSCDGVQYLREYFCSYPDKVMVIRLSSSKPAALSLDIFADCAQESSSIQADNNYIRTKGKVTDNNMGFESLIHIRRNGGTSTTSQGKIKLRNADTITLLMTAATEYKNEYPHYTGRNPSEEVTALMKKLGQFDFWTLKSRHEIDYQELYSRVTLDLDNNNIEDLPTDELIKSYRKGENTRLEALMFQYGRYLLISSSRAGSLPANLQGVWNNSNTPPWRGDYHFDINLQMNYFSSEVTNLSECSDPLVDYINSLRAPGRVTAEKHHGVKNGGWVVHPMNNPFGFTAPGWESYWGWAPFNAAWICQNLWDKYKFSGDKKYLRSHIYPIIREQAEFWKKWLIQDSLGYYVSSPAISPEHLPVTDGPTSDESMCYELFSDVIEAGRILGIDSRFRKELYKMRDKLLPLKVGNWGQLQEWRYDWDRKDDMHRHVSHLVSVYQGERINPYTNHLYSNAAKVSLLARDAVEGDVQGWSLAQRMGLWARLLEPEYAYKNFNYLLKHHINTNLFTLTGNVFQIDANLGIPGMIAEMLIQSHLENIHLLPALPEAWSKGTVKGLRARGGYSIDMVWKEKKLVEATIIPTYKSITTIKCKDLEGQIILKNGSGKNIRFRKKGDSIIFKAQPGQSYYLKVISL